MFWEATCSLRTDKQLSKRGHIVAHDVSWAAQTGKHLLRTQNVSEQTQKHFLCPQQMLRMRANGKHLCRQQCVLVCQGLNNVTSVDEYSKIVTAQQLADRITHIMHI